MDYNKYNCPVCSKNFKDGDDIVVCPICGTPHHRECFENLGHCFNEDKHSESYSFYTSNKPKEERKKLTCPNCKAEVPQDSIFCNKCGLPVNSGDSTHTPYSRHAEEQKTNGDTPPAPMGMYQTIVIDPMGGLKAETEVGEGVTVGEVAKFTKNNSPFYSRLFYQIKSIGKSRFSFVGFLFGGGWMLYRKMYALGTIFTALTALLIFTELFCTVAYASFLNEALLELAEIFYNTGIISGGSVTDNLSAYLSGLGLEYKLVLAGYFIADLGNLVLQFVCGFCCNRWYYKHALKKIKGIKEKAPSPDAADTQLQTKGGVNTALAISLFISYLAVTFLPGLLL